MKLCNTICGAMNFGLTPAQAVEFVAGTGFKHLDYSFYDYNDTDSSFLTDDWMKEIIDAGKAAEKLGVDFVQAHSPNYNFLSEDSAHHKAGMLATKRSIEACEYLGIENIVLHLGFSQKYTYPHGEYAFIEKNAEALRELIPIMEKTGVNVLIENSCQINMNGQYFLMTGKEMKAFISYFNHPLLHSCWDVGHANIEGVDQYEEITALGNELRAIHFQDNSGTADEHLAPYSGTLDIDSVVQGLLAIDYNGYFTFECNNLVALDNGWPRARVVGKHTVLRPAASPSLEVARKGDEMLYEIGKHILSSYGIYEE